VLVGPYSFCDREPDGLATVVKAEGEHATANYKVHGLLHGARAEAFRKWFDKLPDTTPEVGSMYVFVTPLGTGTVPMRIRSTLDSRGLGIGYRDAHGTRLTWAATACGTRSTYVLASGRSRPILTVCFPAL